jgi:hypothetical protein
LLAINKAFFYLIDKLAAFKISNANRNLAIKEREIIFEINNKDK